MTRERITFTPPSGSAIDLTDWVNYFVMPKRAGFWQAKTKFTEVDIPQHTGSKLVEVNTQGRDADLIVLVKDTDMSTLRTRLRSLAKALDPQQGDGRLTVEDESGNKRYLTCRYQDGMEKGEEGIGWVKAPLSFRAADPLWYAETETELDYGLGEEVAKWFPIFPLVLASSTVFTSPTVDNPGDYEAWPVISILGPGSSIRIENTTTGKKIEMESGFALESGETLEIDTRPGIKTAELDGVDVFEELTSDSEMFPLERGDNALKVEMSEADSNSLVTISFQARYWSP